MSKTTQCFGENVKEFYLLTKRKLGEIVAAEGMPWCRQAVLGNYCSVWPHESAAQLHWVKIFKLPLWRRHAYLPHACCCISFPFGHINKSFTEPDQISSVYHRSISEPWNGSNLHLHTGAETQDIVVPSLWHVNCWEASDLVKVVCSPCSLLTVLKFFLKTFCKNTFENNSFVQMDYRALNCKYWSIEVAVDAFK